MAVVHQWSYCTICDRPMMLCGKCDNNTCNGGYGRKVKDDGTEEVCTECPSAYDETDRGWKDALKFVEMLKGLI